jgi:hypothetical protein
VDTLLIGFKMSKYMQPRFTTLRLEAIWTVEIAFVRYAGKIIKGLLKSLQPDLRNSYSPSSTGKSGHWAKVRMVTMEETDPEEGWFEW